MYGGRRVNEDFLYDYTIRPGFLTLLSGVIYIPTSLQIKLPLIKRGNQVTPNGAK